ncbi:MAG: DUF5615 family PIN-like protein [Deltaproteobacteria bacterium]|nr:DUF5615 family PIN-like protein [Deltaproteobacteria bacterium]
MRLLLDQQLSRRLLPRLANVFPDSQHTSGLGLSRGSDTEVFMAARQGGYVLVTMDADFVGLSARFGRPPLVAHLRIGNSAVGDVERTLRGAAATLAAAWADPAVQLVEILPQGQQDPSQAQ